MFSSKNLSLLLFLMGPALLLAQTNWKLDGQVRHRAEIDNRDFNSDTGLDNFNLLRTRIGAAFTAEDSISAYVQIQDSRQFGDENNTLTDASADNLDVHQAFVQIRRFFGLPIHLKLGRMEVAYGSQRLIGSVGWSNTGRSFDGAIFNFQSGANSVDVFGFQETETDNLANVGDRHVIGFNGFINSVNNHSIQPIVIWQRDSPANDFQRFTYGLYLMGKPGALKYEVDAAFQSTSVGSDDYSAMMVAGSILYQIGQSPRKPTIGLGYDFLSGRSGDDKLAFDTMYATNHKFYGYMDYFLSIPGNTLQLGLKDLHAQFSMKPGENSLLKVVFHKFDPAEELNAPFDGPFGNEIDFIFQHHYNNSLTFTGGFSVFMPGDLFKEVRGEDTSTWGFIETSVAIK